MVSGKESACQAGDTGLIAGSGRSPGEGNGNPVQYSCLGNLMDRGAWRATVHGVTESQTWLSNLRMTMLLGNSHWLFSIFIHCLQLSLVVSAPQNIISSKFITDIIDAAWNVEDSWVQHRRSPKRVLGMKAVLFQAMCLHYVCPRNLLPIFWGSLAINHYLKRDLLLKLEFAQSDCVQESSSYFTLE